MKCNRTERWKTAFARSKNYLERMNNKKTKKKKKIIIIKSRIVK